MSENVHAYNNTLYYRRKVKLIADHSLSSRPDIDSWVAQIDEKLCVKFGGCVQLAEAVTLRYLKKVTTIPVPKVYCAFLHQGETYILMEHIDGEPIGKNWTSRSRAENESLILQLKDIMKQLRGIKHPRPGAVAAADIGMDDKADFLSEIYCPWVTTEEREDRKYLGGKIVALINFETAGWYSDYWEYTTAMNVNSHDAPLWKTEISKFLQEYPVELEMESLRRRHFGPRGFWNYLP